MPVKKKDAPFYEKIKDYIKEQIERGMLRPNDKVTSEEELMERFNVSKITTQKAMSLLVKEGIIHRIPGKGTFVCEASNEISKESGEELNLIGFICPYLNTHNTDMLQGIEEEAAKSGYDLLIKLSYNILEEQQRFIQDATQKGIKGLIIDSVEDQFYDDQILKLKLTKYPFVLIDRYLSYLETNVVTSDNFTATYEQTQDFILKGLKNIGFLSYYSQNTITVADRVKGYEKALQDNDILINKKYNLAQNEPKKPFSSVDKMGEYSVKLIEEYLTENKDLQALIISNISWFNIIIDSLRKLKLDNIKEIACFDMKEVSNSHKQREIIGLIQKGREMGKESVRILISEMKNGQRYEHKKLPVDRVVYRLDDDGCWHPFSG